jgi:hypothetical protein
MNIFKKDKNSATCRMNNESNSMLITKSIIKRNQAKSRTPTKFFSS